ncbi:LysR family transcriptional regulator [Streptomyces morookaense]|uniref:LysR family transcriptional regulator n=1 Tax=Streptomyces morookaense TaxID=1970 RepID=A0A7Y7B9X3_STRMO|nr:LysR family transcriptional regulator [Streptomyces morookaense]NVK81718.1 LysR family transcriptional regulator [Streptomyces morookaense]GHF43630.1 small neutral protease regulatory protein [Streptomyces morookaense]
MELEVRHLRALCAIADTGSVRKAALQLGMTQPSLTTQLHRIESCIGGLLFTRGRTGSRPTPLGHSVLARARPIIAEMSALVTAARDAALGIGGARLRIGSIGSRAVTGWLHRIHRRLPETDTTIHIDVSSGVLLQLLATNQLDVALVHETTGFPLPVPAGVERRVLIACEPRFVALSAGHPAAARPVVPLGELAGDDWITDPAADDEATALHRAFTAAGTAPRILHVRDTTTAAELVASGEAVRCCQPTAAPEAGTVVRPLLGDPLTAQLSLASRRGALPMRELDALFGDLMEAYAEAAERNETYRLWLREQGGGLLPLPTGR